MTRRLLAKESAQPVIRPIEQARVFAAVFCAKNRCLLPSLWYDKA
ncbi:hypothetical protein B4113_4023 [Geobacillus sp. B4113_201601]|nr:hypothetical protein B4113_4023 [Geobacillus sp. B4113_201601]